MMAGAYVSPFPIVTTPNYARRDEDGNAFVERRHRFTLAEGRVVDCDPRACREHWREANWPAGGAA